MKIDKEESRVLSLRLKIEVSWVLGINQGINYSLASNHSCSLSFLPEPQPNLTSQLQPQGIELDAEKFQRLIEDDNSIPGILKATAEILYPEILKKNEENSSLSQQKEVLNSFGIYQL